VIPFRSNQLAGLEWRQASAFSRTFDLYSGDSILAHLEWLKLMGTLASAVTAETQWTFKRTGFLTSVVTARVAGSETDIATYQPNWSGTKGQLHCGGQILQLKGANFWATQWVLLDGEMPLLQFGSHGVLKAAAEVTVTEAARERADLPLLLCFVWYILLLHMQDSSSAAVIAT
jgi:hypothetical protein